jgi:hypothetical protein
MAGSEQDKTRNRLNQLHVEVLGRLHKVLQRQKALYRRVIVRRSNLLARRARQDIASGQSESEK